MRTALISGTPVAEGGCASLYARPNDRSLLSSSSPKGHWTRNRDLVLGQAQGERGWERPAPAAGPAARPEYGRAPCGGMYACLMCERPGSVLTRTLTPQRPQNWWWTAPMEDWTLATGNADSGKVEQQPVRHSVASPLSRRTRPTRRPRKMAHHDERSTTNGYRVQHKGREKFSKQPRQRQWTQFASPGQDLGWREIETLQRLARSGIVRVSITKIPRSIQAAYSVEVTRSPGLPGHRRSGKSVNFEMHSRLTMPRVASSYTGHDRHLTPGLISRCTTSRLARRGPPGHLPNRK